MKKHIPNTLTLLNLFSGCLGIYFVFHGNLVYASYTIWLAALFDFLDGFTARLLKVESPIGKQLDSLADLVTFGVLPAFMMMSMVDLTTGYLQFVPLIIALFAALRLAKFNIDETQSTSFLGMPTPAIAFFVSGLPFWLATNKNLFTPPVVIALSIVLAVLMLIPVRMVALKFKNWRFSDNWPRFSLILLGVILFIILGPRSFTITISLYLIISLLSLKKEAIN